MLLYFVQAKGGRDLGKARVERSANVVLDNS